jgi:flavin reductase (DIM6/NTAB) family NADH-FMN oxidoreductase RutF
VPEEAIPGKSRGVEAGRRPNRFASLVGELDYPMLIVTAEAGGERAGCLVGFSTQASIDPPCFLVCLSKRNRTCEVAMRARSLVVHVVSEEASGLAELFGGQTGDQVDKFSACDWIPGPDGTPVLTECAGWFAARIQSCLDVGDHVAFLLEPFELRPADGLDPLRTSDAAPIEPGHQP